jgi:hypothetical protein
MQFSNDGVSWSAWLPFASTASWTLPAGEGARSVRARFRDRVGLVSAEVLDSISVDTGAPYGTILINSGAGSTRSYSVTLTLSAGDARSGVTQMRFSNDGFVWSAWTPYATSASWTLSSGDGTKTVRAQFRDAAGNLSAVALDSINKLAYSKFLQK